MPTLILRVRNTATQETHNIGTFEPPTLPGAVAVGQIFTLKTVGNWDLEFIRSA